jgi:hypothetical protein
MKQFLTALAVAFVALFVFAGCNDYGNTFQNNTGAQITTISPSNIAAGSSTFTLTVTGSGFVAQTYIAWNGMKLTTTDIDDVNGNVLEVTAQIPASLVAAPGKATVITHNPFSGAGNNGLSNPINFIINPVVQPNPVPLLQSLSPNNATAGATMPLALTLMGSDFVTGSNGATVFWTVGSTATMLTATVVNSTQINATVPTNLLSSAGTAAVNVVNPPNTAGTPPAGGGGPGNALAFTVNAAPSASMAKAQAVAEETPAVSADGRYVAYTAMQGHYAQIFFRDTCTEAVASCQPHTALVSITSDGSAANADSHSPSVSADGRYVAFSSTATNLLATSAASPESAALPGPGRQIYLRDTCTGTPSSSCTPSTALISTDASGALSGTESILPSISASGRFVAFVAVMPSKGASGASAAQSGGTSNSGYRQIFVRDTCLGATSCTPRTSRISMQAGDGTENGPAAGIAPGPALSSNGKQLALTGGDTALRFTRSVAVDDLLFLAAVNEQP